MKKFSASTQRLLTVWYQRHPLRIVVNGEIRFVTEDVRRIARVPESASNLLAGMPSLFARDPIEGVTMDTLGWSQALNLIEAGDLESSEVQHFGSWFLHDLIAELCANGVLTGTELLDTSAVQYSSIFHHAVAAEMPDEAAASLRLH